MAQPKIATKSNGTQQAISTNKFWDNLNQIRINILENLSIKIRKIKSKFIMGKTITHVENLMLIWWLTAHLNKKSGWWKRWERKDKHCVEPNILYLKTAFCNRQLLKIIIRILFLGKRLIRLEEVWTHHQINHKSLVLSRDRLSMKKNHF